MTFTKERAMPYVRWSELDVDVAQLDRFISLAGENIRQSRLTESGVIAFHAAAESDHPNRIHVLEAYVDADAYEAHVQTSHFRMFRSATSDMVDDRKLFEVTPVVPLSTSAKSKLPPNIAVRMADLQIDPSRLDAYIAAVAAEIESSIDIEAGVFAIYALASKEQSNRLRFFEIYADGDAYLLHRETPHFKKYINATRSMITARRLIVGAPIAQAPPS